MPSAVCAGDGDRDGWERQRTVRKRQHSRHAVWNQQRRGGRGRPGRGAAGWYAGRRQRQTFNGTGHASLHLQQAARCAGRRSRPSHIRNGICHRPHCSRPMHVSRSHCRIRSNTACRLCHSIDSGGCCIARAVCFSERCNTAGQSWCRNLWRGSLRGVLQDGKGRACCTHYLRCNAPWRCPQLDRRATREAPSGQRAKLREGFFDEDRLRDSRGFIRRHDGIRAALLCRT